MATNRAAKSGFAREAQNKINEKYDMESAAAAMQWIRERTGMEIDTSGDPDKVAEALHDGYVLIHIFDPFKHYFFYLSHYITDMSSASTLDVGLMNSLGIPTPIKKLKRETMAFKKMECINGFLDGCSNYGVAKSELFQTVDLYESQNLNAVIICISSLGRKVLKNGGPGYGIKESDQNRRTFTDEQLKAGQNVIGLQMGTNKGASQAGQNFGKARMIMD